MILRYRWCVVIWCCLFWLGVYEQGCTWVGCDAVCTKQYACYQGKLDRDKCLQDCQKESNAGRLCQQYYNCWNQATCEQMSSCVDSKALCP